MEIQYVIINFIILAIILFLFGRKKIRSIFNSRFERINRELDEAEATEKIAMPVFEEYRHEEYDENDAEEITIARTISAPPSIKSIIFYPPDIFCIINSKQR